MVALGDKNPLNSSFHDAFMTTLCADASSVVCFSQQCSERCARQRSQSYGWCFQTDPWAMKNTVHSASSVTRCCSSQLLTYLHSQFSCDCSDEDWLELLGEGNCCLNTLSASVIHSPLCSVYACCAVLRCQSTNIFINPLTDLNWGKLLFKFLRAALIKWILLLISASLLVVVSPPFIAAPPISSSAWGVLLST